jgi:polyhydroxyalkanoate synthase
VNNYLLGKDPFPFDLLYWNADQTNLPKAVHLFYLRECYLKNTLAKGQMTVGGVTLDLSKVKTPVYLLSSKEDHIAPFRSVFKSTKLFGGPKRFIVAGSGHIAGVINPPVARKYQFWANESDPTPLSLDQWWAGAKETHGSWWLDWDQWASAQSGPKVKARVPGDGKLKPLEDAPGSYVRVRAM